MLDFNPDNKKVILSLDGGGMRGVIPLQMLIYLEEQTGRPAYELFDFIGGTSTGAIIAVGLALGLRASEIMEQVYMDILPAAFGRRNLAFWLRYVMRGMRAFYPVEPFLDSLRGFAAGKRIKDLADSPGVLLTTKDLRTSNTYYITSQGPGAAAFADWTVIGAVGASSAAPIYFPPILGNFVDGGVGAFANPCLATAIEAVEYIGYEPENTLFISLGTGYVSTAQPDGAGSRFWLPNWLEYIILEGLDDAALQQSYITRLMYKNMDFRRYNVNLDTTTVRDTLGVKTASLDPAKLSLDTVSRTELDLMRRIGTAYAKQIDWQKPQVMPWDTPGGHPRPAIAPVDWTHTPFK